MMTSFRSVRFLSWLCAGLGAWPGAIRLAAETPLSRSVPAQAIACLEVFEPARLLDPLLSVRMRDRVTALPAYAAWRATPPARDVQGVVSVVEATAQTNWPAVARTLTRQGLALAVGERNRHLLILAGDDPALLGRLHDLARQFATSEADRAGTPERVRSAEVGGVTGWSFNGREAHALLGPRLLAASDPQVLKAALDVEQSGAGSLADREPYRAARRAVGTNAAALLFLDLERVREAPGFLPGLDGARGNPLVALLLATLPDTLKTAPWLALGVYLEGNDLRVRAFAGPEAVGPEVAPFARPGPGADALQPGLEVPRQLASLSLHRDLAAFYAAKDTLFPQRTSGLIFFENMMGIFFSGKNLTDEVFAELQPGLRVVVARPQFDPALGTPEPQLPAFAVVVGLRHPERFGLVVEEAWQKALGLVNFTRGQQALPGLILDRVEHAGTPITVASFSAKEVPDRAHLDQRFNFRPSLALARGHAILSSSDQLARDTMDALGRPAGAPAALPHAHSALALRGAELAAILQANRAALVRGNMVKEGKSQAEAELAMDTLTALAGWVDRATLEVGRGGPVPAAELRLKFTAP